MIQEQATNPRKPELPMKLVTDLSKRVSSIVNIKQISGEFDIPALLSDVPMRVSLSDLPATAMLEELKLYVDVGFMFEAVPDMDEEEEGQKSVDDDLSVLVAAYYKIDYDLMPEGDAPTEETLKAFADINGRFNTISYWREFLHSCLARAGLPPFIVPPFDAAAKLRALNKVEKKQLPEQSEDTSE